MNAKNPHAQALGKLGGKASGAKPLTMAQIAARRQSLEAARKKRWSEKRVNIGAK
jgi:hypothetical protein